MAKRFATMFFIMIGVVVFLLSAYILVLFLAPGASVFGIKYIMVNTHAVNTGKVRITETFRQKYGDTNFSGSIIVNSSEVPVIVEFTESGYEYYYQYYDNYSGITKSSIQDPSIVVERDNDGNAVFTVKSYESFIFQNGNSQRFIKLFIPLANISVSDYAGKQQFIYGDADPGAEGKYSTDLIINSVKADVQFYKSDADRAPAFDLLKIKTTGNVIYNGTHVKAMTFEFETNKTIKVSSSRVNIVDAKNYTLVSTSGRILAERELSGNLSAETKNGNIIINKCANLKVRTDLGDIVSCFKERGIQISGVVDIVTNAGSVEIDSILGTGQNNIKTGSGSVVIRKINNGTIATHRGSVTIKSVNNVVISTNMGSVDIEEALTSVDVTTKRGKIQLGAEGMVLNSPKANSYLGDVSIIDASGTVFISTIESDINFVNKNSDNIEINAGGKLTAKNLKGLITMTLSGESYLEFSNISNATKLLLNDSCKFVKIDALSVVRSKLNYMIVGKPASIYESNNAGYATYSLIDSKNYLTNDNKSGILFEVIGISAEGNASAKVDVYFNKSNEY